MKRSGSVYHLMVPLALALVVPTVPGSALGQGQALPPIKVDLPPSPNFNTVNVPEQYPSGELSVYGLRKRMARYMDKDVQVKAYLLQIYECPEELRKCNDELSAKAKKAAKKQSAKETPPMKGAAQQQAAATGCRPCDQPHFFMADSPTTKIERALLVADYPIKDWTTGKPKPLVAEVGKQYVVTGTFAINSMTGFGASDGLIIHKKFQDASGAVIAEGNAVLPPEAANINLEGKGVEKVGAARFDDMKK